MGKEALWRGVGEQRMWEWENCQIFFFDCLKRWIVNFVFELGMKSNYLPFLLGNAKKGV